MLLLSSCPVFWLITRSAIWLVQFLFVFQCVFISQGPVYWVICFVCEMCYTFLFTVTAPTMNVMSLTWSIQTVNLEVIIYKLARIFFRNQEGSGFDYRPAGQLSRIYDDFTQQRVACWTSDPKVVGLIAIRHEWAFCGYVVAQWVEALRYKSEDCGFDSQWGLWDFSLT